MKLRTLLIYGLALASVPMLCACDTAAPESQDGTAAAAAAAPVRLAEVKLSTIKRRIRVSATIEPNQKAMITPEVGGMIRRIYKQEGDAVRQGERLILIAATNYDLAVEGAQSGLEAAQAGFDTAAAQYERFKKLRQDNVIPQAEFEQIESRYKAAKAQLQAADTGLRSANKRASDTMITAPFSGHVVSRMKDPGDVVRPMGSPVLAIVNNNPAMAEAAVREVDSPSVRVGMAVEVALDAFPNQSFVGQIVMVNQQIDPRTRTVSIRAQLDNADGSLKAGMAGDLIIDLGERQALTVPRIALVERHDDRARVYVVNDGMAHIRDVVIEPSLGGDFPVLEGLSAGDHVVNWGHARLEDGMPVEVLPPVELVEKAGTDEKLSQTVR